MNSTVAAGAALQNRGWVRASLPPLTLLGLTMALAPLAMSMHVPSLVSIAREFSIPLRATGATVSVFLVGYSVSVFLTGFVSDCFGRRPVLIGSLVLYIAGAVLAAVAPTLDLLVAARLVQSVSVGAIVLLPYAIVQDLLGGRALLKAVSLLTVWYSLVFAGAPVLGGILSSTLGWRAAFWTMAAICLPVLFWAARRLPVGLASRKPRPGYREAMRRYIGIVRDSRFYIYASNLAASAAMLHAFLGVGPKILSSAGGFSEFQIGVVIGGAYACYAYGNDLASKLSALMTTERLFKLGSAVTVTGSALLFVLSPHMNVYGFLLYVGICVVGAGISTAPAMAGATNLDQRIAGNICSLLFSVQAAVGAFAVCAAGSTGPSRAIEAYATTIFASCIVMVLCLLFIGKQRPKRGYAASAVGK